MSLLLHIGKATTSGSLGVECFQPYFDISDDFLIPPPSFIPMVMSKFLAECVTGQSRLGILVAPCWMEAAWHATTFNMLADIPHQCPFVKYLVLDVLVGQVSMDIQSLHLTLWLLRDDCCTDKDSFPQSVRQRQ